MEKLPVRQNSQTAGLGTSAAVLCYFIIAMAASAVVQAAQISGDAVKYISYLVSPVSLCAAVAITLAFRRQKPSAIAPVKCGVKYYIIALLLIFGVFGLLGDLNDYVTRKIFSPLGYTQRDPSSYIPDLSGGGLYASLLVIALLPAIFEELAFRGLILFNLRKDAGDIRSVFIVGFVFALFHGSPEQTVYQFICGCIFALLAIRSGSVLPGMLIHFLNNAAVLVLSAAGLTDPVTGSVVMSQAAGITVNVLGGLSLAGGLVWLLVSKAPVQKCSKGGVAYYFLYASVGLVVLAVQWISSFFI